MTRAASSKPVEAIPGYDPVTTAGECAFDDHAAAHAVDFFHECLTLTAGEWRSQAFVLEPWQRAIVSNLFG